MLLGRDHLLWVLGSLCQVQRIPFDSNLLLHNFPPPFSDVTLMEAGKALGLRIGAAKLRGVKPEKLPLPCIAFLNQAPPPSGAAPDPAQLSSETDPGKASSNATSNGPSPSAPIPALIMRVDRDRVLYFEAGSQNAKLAPLASIHDVFASACFFVSHEARVNEPVEGLVGEHASTAEPFGFRWFARELLKHKSIWRNVLAASLAIQLIGLTTPLFTQVIIDKVVVHQTQSTLVVIAVGLAMFMLFSAGMSWLRQYLVIHTGNRVDAVLGSQVFRHLLRLFMPYFEARSTGTLVARLHAVESIREFMAGAAISLILDLPFLIVFLVVMFVYSWELSLIAVAMLALIAVASVAVTPLLRARLNRQFLLGARNQAFLTEYLSGMETVKSLQMEPRLESRYEDYLAAYLAAGFSTRALSNTYNTVANALEQAMTLLILCVGALMVMRNDGFTVGMLVAFQMFAGRMSQPMLRLASLWQEFQQASISIKRLGDIMNAPVEPWALIPSRAADGEGRVEIRDLSFGYRGEGVKLFKNLNITLQPGKLSVLTGPSGSGKSTLAKLLLSFYQPDSGQILLDGRDIRHLSANELRQYYGVVPQETRLFSGTVYENLMSASPHAGFQDVVNACKAAEIHDVIEKLPRGYNTTIGEHGVGLSGGQKQRLAIARAVLKRPKILIFDEATSNLDSPTAELFAQTINQLKGQVTILFIAHQRPRGLLVDEVFSIG
ncbi:MAG: ABC transporter [Betaproteobacteria bacterium RIFCSPLOWO2_02_FULL_62_17]|nr:MAG: ABC transporter [Betaproteobacteria bacterium RIFCSPLOWO2_02_FULL_62_17]